MKYLLSTEQCRCAIGAVKSVFGIFLDLRQLQSKCLQAIARLATRDPVKLLKCQSHCGLTISTYGSAPKLLFLHTRRGYLYLPPPIYHVFHQNAWLNMLILFTSALVWAVLSSAETYCEDTPTYPPIASCARAITVVERFVRECGIYDRTFGPPGSEATIELPILFVDKGYNGEGGSCSFLLIWDPKPGSDYPADPPWNFDAFLAVEILRAADRIRNACVPDHKIGHEWISPEQWVQVRLMISWFSNATDIAGGPFIGTVNGTNVTVVNEGILIRTVQF